MTAEESRLFFEGKNKEAEHVAALLLALASATDPTNVFSIFIPD